MLGFSFALSYLLLNDSTKAMLVFHMYSNLYFLVGYIQDVIIVPFWYVIFFFPGGGTLLYISYFYLIFNSN